MCSGHKAAAFPNAPLRPADRARQHQLPEPALTPLHRAWAFGEALRRSADASPERLALIGTGGISHWPATPDSGKINEPSDREFLDRWCRDDRQALCSYDDTAVYTEAGHGGFEIRTFLTISVATSGAPGTIHFFAPIPIFAVGCTVADYRLS